MFDNPLPFWTIVIGILCNVSCAILGCYLVLRRMSLIGDAISHAVLPGLVIAFVISESRASVPMFLGAMSVGVLTAFLTQTLHRFAGVSRDASMGVVFTTLFALGVVLIRVIPGLDEVHLDPDCVFEGAIEYEAIDPVGPVLMLSGVLVANLVFVVVLWKELKLATFDPALCSSLGFSSALLYYLLMAMVAATTVASFWAVGSILVIAMLIVPGATAHLLTDRFGLMVVIATIVGVVSSIFGYFFASLFDASTAGMMAVVVGVQYALAALFAPRYGVLPRWFRNARLSLHIICDDIVAAVYRWSEGRGVEPMPRAELAEKVPASGWQYAIALWFLGWRRHVEATSDGFMLSNSGKERAAQLVRSHRLWESYLAEHVGIQSDHLHEPALRMEHFVTPEIDRELVDGLANPEMDPHGKPIPKKRPS